MIVDRPIALASRNAGKLAELRALSDGRLDLVPMPESPESPEVEEDGETYLENALRKAVALAGLVGGPALADDSGLEVDGLDGRPGVRSARYGGPGLDDAGRCRALLAELAGRGAGASRRARFRCVLALVSGGEVLSAEGVLEGEIAPAPRGAGGFGYDPVFVPDALGGRTLAEATAEEKNRVSHRARAVERLVERLAAVRRSDPSDGGPAAGPR